MLCACACSLAVPAFSQGGVKATEKIVFVRPDPLVTTSPEAVHMSADPVGGAIHAQDDPGVQFHAAADAKMNLLANYESRWQRDRGPAPQRL
jgi:hypothetical protein